MAKRRNVRVLLRRGAGKPARSAMRACRDRRNRPHALPASGVQQHDAGLPARRSAARFVGNYTAHNPVHEKAGGNGRRSDHDGSTYDNAEHLSADFLRKVRELYEGTRLDRQDTMILDPHRPQGAGAGAETREAGAAPARRQAGRGVIAYPHSGSQG